jgi:hypothetical protein
MNNDALVAALGMDAVAAVHHYRQQVISEAERRGLRLVNAAPSGLAQFTTNVRVIDPIDIRLTFLHSVNRGNLTGCMLSWCPAQGWSLSRPGTRPDRNYYAGPRAAPLQLVPTASEVLEWASDVLDDPVAGHFAPPRGVELDEDPQAINRLLSY